VSDSFNQEAREREEQPENKTRARYATEEAYQRALESKRRYEKRRVAKIAKKRLARRNRENHAKAVRNDREAEFGKIVTKLKFDVGLSQDAIYALLGGLVTNAEIARWCSKAKKKR
jgi:hypothetical protein